MPHQFTLRQSDDLRQAVARQYGQVAVNPLREHPFPVGRAFAEEVGYTPEMLAQAPAEAVSAFAGLSCPLLYAGIAPDETVLDLGCGAGLDSILAARQVGKSGQVYAVDLSTQMIAAARENADRAGVDNITFYLSPAEQFPLNDSIVDVILVNGIFNLCPDKRSVVDETLRVLRPGGRMILAEIMLKEEAADSQADQDFSLESWFK